MIGQWWRAGASGVKCYTCQALIKPGVLYKVILERNSGRVRARLCSECAVSRKAARFL